jgi:2-haloalkanoic acid dehalogenase type II
MKIKYLTFDCYGTLIDWRRGIVENFKKFAKFQASTDTDVFERYVALESENERSYTTYIQILASTFLKLAHQLNLDPSEKDAQIFAESITTWPAFEDTSTTLRTLGDRGFKRIILSNIDRMLLEGTIRESELEVDGFISADEIKSYKPQSAHWLEMLRKYHTDRTEVLHVAGSIYHDIAPASNLGFKTVWVNRYKETIPQDITPTYSVSSLSEVLEIL